jgi:ankyrin repeat protein
MDRGYSWNVHDLQRSENEIASPLYYAALPGLEYTLKRLITIGGDELSMVDIVNAAGGEHHNALEAASSRGHLEVVQMLVDRGANIGNALQKALDHSHTPVSKRQSIPRSPIRIPRTKRLHKRRIQ